VSSTEHYICLAPELLWVATSLDAKNSKTGIRTCQRHSSTFSRIISM